MWLEAGATLSAGSNPSEPRVEDIPPVVEIPDPENDGTIVRYVEFTQAEVEELIIDKKKGISVVVFPDARLGKKVYNLLAEEYETAKVKGLDK